MCRTLLTLLLACASLQGAVETCLADIAGDGAAHAIATSGSAIYVSVTASPANATTTCGTSSIAGCARVGDASTSTSRGQWLVPGAGKFYPMINPFNASPYPLSTIFYLAQSGDKVTICYVQ